jgi:hypothetical protein
MFGPMPADGLPPGRRGTSFIGAAQFILDPLGQP